MEPIWLEQYPSGVPEDCVVEPDETLITDFEAAVAEWPNRPAFTNFGHTLSFAEIDDLSRRFAAYLQNQLNVQPGDRVALMLPNLLQYPIALYGCLRAGAVAQIEIPLGP